MSVASAIMVTVMGVHAPSVEAKSLRLTSKKVTLTVGKSKTIKVRGAKKVTWKVTSGRKVIRLSAKTRTSVKITAKKAGSAKVQAKAGNKKISCRVTVKPKNKKTTVLNVTKVDDATVKKVHETLSKGNTLKIRISGGKQSERTNTMNNLKVAVSKYNEYGVRPQLSSHTTKSYTEWEADSELAGQYKWGLLLVKDIVDNYNKNSYKLSKESMAESDAKAIAYKETELKNKYKFEGDEWRQVFKEVTGIPYTHGSYEHGDYSNSDFNYTDGQTAKNSENELLPDGYYYVTYKTDGKEVTRTAEVESFFKKRDWISYYYNSAEYLEFKEKIDKEYEAKWEEKRKQLEEEIKQRESIDDCTKGVLIDEAWDALEDEKSAKESEEENKRLTEYYSKTDSWYFDIDGKQLSLNDITFHYEPLTVDLTAVDTAINTKITTELNTFKETNAQKEKQYEESQHGKIYKLFYENKFCDLSSAVQQYFLDGIFGCGGRGAGKSYMTYEPEYAAKLGYKKYKGLTNPKGRIHGEGGAEGLKLAYQRKWMGICDNYADLEMTLYDLFGLQGTKIRCYKCNHAWSVVKLTNSEGKVYYVKNNYGLQCSYTAMPDGCIKHNRSKNTGIDVINKYDVKYN